MAFKMSGFSGFTKQIDDKDIANIAKEKGISVSMVNNILKEIKTLHQDKHKGRELWWLSQAYYLIKDYKSSQECQKLAQEELYRKAERIRDKKIREDYHQLPPLHKEIFMKIEDVLSNDKIDKSTLDDNATNPEENNVYKFCPSCGFNNEKLFKFCPGCGAALLSN